MKRIIFIIFGVVVLFFAGVYLLYAPSIDKFPTPTEINGIEVSGLTVEEAADKLSETWNSKDFSFKYKGKFYLVSLKSLTYDLSLDTIMSSMSRLEKFKYFLHIGNEYEIPMHPNESEEFLKQIKDLSFCDNTDKEKTENAYVDLSDFEFRVVKEKIGTEIDPNTVKNIAYDNIAAGTFSTELTESEIIKQPEITENSPEIKQRLEYCEDNLDFKLECDVNGETEVITPKQMDEMVTYTDKGAEFKKDAIESYVNDLAGKCNEYNRTYNFTTHGGSEISVQGVTFGKVLDKSAMIEEIKKALEDQMSQKLDLQWAQLKYSGGDGIGDSYIEVSIADQHVWCVKNGKTVVECDCVTGAPGHDTARGVFIVQYITGPTVLRGDNGDGTHYESPVNCFIPFYGGQGFHGSNGWRSQWGGQIYKTSGSHGCVNCPDDAAKKMADTVVVGYPVVIY